MSIPKLQPTTHALFEVEQAISLFLASDPFPLSALKQLTWIWDKLPRLGKILAPFFSKRQFWKKNFLLPVLIDCSLNELERMSRSEFKKHEEASLLVLWSFLKESHETELLVHKKATPEMMEFLSKEPVSFQKTKDLFRKRMNKEGISEEHCIWYRNETLAQYVKRIEGRLPSCLPENAPRLMHTESLEKKKLSEPSQSIVRWEISSGLKRDCRLLKEHIMTSILSIEDLKKQIKVFKHRSFLLRAENECPYNEFLLLETRLVNLSILLEELLPRISEGALSVCTHEKEARAIVSQEEEEVEKVEKEIEKIKFGLKTQTQSLANLKKKVSVTLQALTKKVSSMEEYKSKDCYSDIRERLFSQAKHALEEYRKGLLKAPGLLFSLHKLETYIEEILTLSESFLQTVEKNAKEKADKDSDTKR